MESHAVPLTWPLLLANDLDLLREGLDIIHDVPRELDAARPPRLPAIEFGGPSLTLAQAAVVLGPSACMEAFDTLLPLLPRVLADFSAGITAVNRVPAQYLLSFCNTAVCCGVSLPSVAALLEREWLPQLASHADVMAEPERSTLALAAIAAGRPGLVSPFIGGGSLSTHLTPGETFNFNVQGFIRYLASAVQQGTPLSAIEPAWETFIDTFPYKLAASTLDWSHLLYAGRVVATSFEGRAVGTVAESLHRRVSG